MSLPHPGEPKNLQERIQRVVDEEVLPLLQMDGGGVEVVGIEDGVVRVRMHGTCSGCPASVQAVVMGVEQELRSRVPEIAYLEAVP
jgi:Fe-S cluster biogenesis protein NfuA